MAKRKRKSSVAGKSAGWITGPELAVVGGGRLHSNQQLEKQ